MRCSWLEFARIAHQICFPMVFRACHSCFESLQLLRNNGMRRFLYSIPPAHSSPSSIIIIPNNQSSEPIGPETCQFNANAWGRNVAMTIVSSASSILFFLATP